MKIIFITLNLGKGGAEKVFTTLVKSFSTDYEIHVVSIHKGGYYEAEILKTNVRYYTLNGSIGNTIKYILRLRSILKEVEPDLIVSFLWYPNIVSSFAKMFLNIKLILSERSNHRIYLKENIKKRYFWKPALKFAYKYADLIIPNSKKMGINIHKDFGIPNSKIRIINNGINYQKINQLSNEPVNDFSFDDNVNYIATVGRLNEPKNNKYLLDAFSVVCKKQTNLELLFIGDGSLKESLVKQVTNLQLDSKVHFLGFKANPYKYLKKANLYVMSSKREGFPNALIEGMYVVGKVISTNCETGPDEIISDEIDGYLVDLNDAVSFGNKIITLLNNKELQAMFYKNSRLKILQFSEKIMIESFKSCINEI